MPCSQWSVPYIGAIKVGLVLSSDPKSGFEAAVNKKTTVETTSTWACKTSDNVAIAFTIKVEDNQPAKTTVVSLEMNQVPI